MEYILRPIPNYFCSVQTCNILSGYSTKFIVTYYRTLSQRSHTGKHHFVGTIYDINRDHNSSVDFLLVLNCLPSNINIPGGNIL